MSPQGNFFLKKEGWVAKILFFCFITLTVALVTFSLPQSPFVEVGWGYAIITNPPILPVRPPGSSSSGEENGDAGQQTQSAAVVINGGATTAASRNVTLTLNAQGATQVGISNTSDFENSVFEIYEGTKFWTLTEGSGTKTIYLRFRSDTGGTVDTSATIVLHQKSIDNQANFVKLRCVVGESEAFRAINSSAVYITRDGCKTKQTFSNPQIFLSHFDGFNRVAVVPQTYINTIPNNSATFISWGPGRDYKNGDILKTPTDSKVFIIVNGKKNWITSEAVFLALYKSWSVVEDIDQKALEAFIDGVEITDTQIHPDGTVVKTANSSKVYVVDNSRLRWIVNESVFKRFKYRLDHIFTITNFEAYDIGPDVVS